MSPSIELNNFSWIINNKLGGMALPITLDDCRYTLQMLQSIKVGLLVSLTEQPFPCTGTQVFGSSYDYLIRLPERKAPKMIHIPIDDFSVPTFEQIDYFIHELRKTLQNNQSTIVHCHAGLGRTGLMLACALVAVSGMPPEQAVQMVREKRPNSICTSEQKDIVYKYAEYLYPLRPTAVNI